jgi:hypothetical protein
MMPKFYLNYEYLFGIYRPGSFIATKINFVLRKVFSICTLCRHSHYCDVCLKTKVQDTSFPDADEMKNTRVCEEL